MEWQKYGINTYINEAKTIIMAKSLEDLPQDKSFSGNLGKISDFEVVSKVEGKGSAKERLKKKYESIDTKQVMKMTSKFGNTSYFDVNLIMPFINDFAMLYLPCAEDKNGVELDAPLVIVNEDVVYLVLPYYVEEFIEDVTLERWI
jgi:hypothetical protein